MKKTKFNVIRYLLKVLSVLAFFIASAVLSGCKDNEIYTDGLSSVSESDIANEKGIVGDKLPVTRASAAKMLAYYFYDDNEINSFDRIIDFEDVSQDKWYDKYINAVFKGGFMFGADEKNFKPDGYLTLNQAQAIIDRMDKNNKIKIKLTDENKDKAISTALWNELYIKVLENKGYGKIKKQKLILAASSAQSNDIKDGFVITDIGLFYAQGINTDNIIGTEAEALIKDKNILTINEITDTRPFIKNVLITDSSESGVEVFIGGMKRRLELSEDISYDIKKGDICSIKINADKIVDLNVTEDKINSKIIMADDEKIELEAIGDLFYEKEFKVYFYDGKNAAIKDISYLISGESYEFYINKGRLCAAVANSDNKSDKIRVLLNNNENKNFNGMVNIGCEGDFTIITGKDERNYKADQEIVIEKDKNNDLFSKERIIVKADDEKNNILIKSIKIPGGGFLSVNGSVEIRKENEGYIVVNEVGIEEYTASVLNTIKAENLNDEILKLMSVVIRSKAYKQKQDNKLLEFGANVDRTQNYQLYACSKTDEKSRNIVYETMGLCITYEDKCLDVNYFSQDCGSSAVMGEVWSKELVFPFESDKYSRSVKFLSGNYPDLSNEEIFRKFIDNGADDTNSDWFRWSFKMNQNELAACVNASIKWLYKDYPAFVKCLDKSGKFISKEVENIGNIKNIEVIKRGEGGNVMELKITAGKEIVILKTDNVIRKIIKPKQFVYGRNPVITNKKGYDSAENLDIMPSGFFYVNTVKDENGNLTEAEFKGGGYGHGVGISLKRAEYLASNKKSFEEIIKYFYPAVTVKSAV